MSTELLYEEFELARKADGCMVEQEEPDFYIYTREKNALAKGLSGLQPLFLMKCYGVDNFILDYFNFLHTQGNENGVLIFPAAIAELKTYKPIINFFLGRQVEI